MAKTIKYKSQCVYCSNWFEKGQAYLHRVMGQWKCQCFECYEKRKKDKIKNKKILDDLVKKYEL